MIWEHEIGQRDMTTCMIGFFSLFAGLDGVGELL